jgi:uncharacterized membrane-anchored protein
MDRVTRWTTCLLLLGYVTWAGADEATPAVDPDAENPFAELDWKHGPTEVTVLGQAKLAIPEGYSYLEPKEAAKFEEMMQNPASGEEGIIAPEDLSWFGVFSFDDIGYVKDDEKIDAEALLASLREGNEAGNEERRKRGWDELTITGWSVAPHYDSNTRRLEWAIAAESGGGPIVNLKTRLLGRKGVTSAVLVASPEDLEAATVTFNQILGGFNYLPGQRYADMQKGDKIAEYGLAALIAGGGAAVAAKSGLLKSLWKVIALGGVAVAAAVRKLFGKKDAQNA